MEAYEDARFRKALLELYESANLSDVSSRILEAVKLLIPGDVLAVTEVNYRTGHIGGYSLPAPEDCLSSSRRWRSRMRHWNGTITNTRS